MSESKTSLPISYQDTHTISILVTNKPGTLLRISTIFSRRGFNIESLVVSPALDGRYSRMTITAAGDSKTLEQIIKQVNKLVDVIGAETHLKANVIEMELALIKVSIKETSRSSIVHLIQHFKANTVDLTDQTVVIRVTGKTDKLDAFITMLTPYGILELVRTGKILMARGPHRT